MVSLVINELGRLWRLVHTLRVWNSNQSNWKLTFTDRVHQQIAFDIDSLQSKTRRDSMAIRSIESLCVARAFGPWSKSNKLSIWPIPSHLTLSTDHGQKWKKRKKPPKRCQLNYKFVSFFIISLTFEGRDPGKEDVAAWHIKKPKQSNN